MSRIISFKVDEDLYKIIESRAKERNISKSEFIRRAIRHYLEEMEEKAYITSRVRVY